MTTAGWILFALSWGGILALAGFCFLRVMARRSQADRHDSPPTPPG